MWRIIVETDAITSRQTTLLRSTYVPVHIMELQGEDSLLSSIYNFVEFGVLTLLEM
jgi:hypothetical protein